MPFEFQVLSSGDLDSNIGRLFPVIGSNLHPVHPNEFQAMLLGEVDGLEGPPLGELLTADILGPEVQTIKDWLPEQHEQVPVRLGSMAQKSAQAPRCTDRDGGLMNRLFGRLQQESGQEGLTL